MTHIEQHPHQPIYPVLSETAGPVLNPEAQLAVAVIDGIAAHSEQVTYPEGGNPQLKLWLSSADNKAPTERIVLTQSASARYGGKFSPDGNGVMIDYKQGRTRRSFMVHNGTDGSYSVTELSESRGQSEVRGSVSEEMAARVKNVMEQGEARRPRGWVARHLGAFMAKRNTSF